MAVLATAAVRGSFPRYLTRRRTATQLFRAPLPHLTAALAAAGCVSPLPLPQYPSGPVAGVPSSTIRQAAHGESEPLPPPTTPAAALPAVVTLPDAIQECMYANLRVRAKGEKVQQAMA